jgi:hypothetical protein
MDTTQSLQTEFSDADMQAFKPAMKIGLLATVNPAGLPHITLITSLMASSPVQMVWGQFTEGLSKQHILANPKSGWLIMSLARAYWRGKARYTHTSRSGKEYDFYNNIPMFRYNAYFGIHTVYYMDLIGHGGKEELNMGKVVFSAVLSRLARAFGRHRAQTEVMNDWTEGFFNTLDNLKFLAYIDKDGYPLIIPAIQTQCLDRQHLLFSTAAYGKEIAQIPAGRSLAVFGMSLSMEDVLVRGTYYGIRSVAGIPCGVVEVDWAYNSMPPVPGQIYPLRKIEAVSEFGALV